MSTWNPLRFPVGNSRLMWAALACIAFLALPPAIAGHAAAGDDRLFLGFERPEGSGNIPKGWELITYFRKRENRIELIEERGSTVLKVTSIGSASGLLKRLQQNVGDVPLLAWRWKIDRTVGMAMESRKDRLDCAARIRVIFGGPTGAAKGKPSPLSRGLEKLYRTFGLAIPHVEPSGYKIDYIWANRMKKGEVRDHPGARKHKLVAVESGNELAGRWLAEQRDLLADFRSLFGGDPPPLAGVVILTDTDQTNEGVEAFFCDIVLKADRTIYAGMPSALYSLREDGHESPQRVPGLCHGQIGGIRVVKF